jgi:hypothetical protein
MVLFFVLLKCTPLGLRKKHDYISLSFFCVLGQVVAVGNALGGGGRRAFPK